MKKEKILGLFAMVITILIWGESFISIERTVNVFQPMTLGLYRFIIAVSVLFIILIIKKESLKIDFKDLPRIMASGAFGITVYFYFENNGIKLMRASTAALVIATIPLFTIVLESIIKREKIKRKVIISLIISLIGVYYVIGEKFSDLLQGSGIKAYLLMFGAVISWAIYTIITSRITDKYSTVKLTFYQSLFGMLFFIPFSVFEKVQWQLVNGEIIAHLVFLGLFSSAVAMLLYITALKLLDVSLTSIFINGIPLVTLIIAYVFLDDPITINKYIGGFLIILSVTIATYEKKGGIKEY